MPLLRRLLLLVVVVVVPVIGYGAAVVVEQRMSFLQHAAALQKEAATRPGAPAAASAASLGLVVDCDPRSQARQATGLGSLQSFWAPSVRTMCTAKDIAPWVKRAALAAAGLGTAALAAITVAGFLARLGGIPLTLLFATLLPIASVVTTVVTILDGGLVIATVWLAAALITSASTSDMSIAFQIGRAQPVLMLIVGALTLFTLSAVVQTMFKLVRRARTRLIATRLDESVRCDLWDLVREVAASVGVKPPRHLVVGLNPGIFATHARLDLPDGRIRGYTLYVSLPFSLLLTPAEVRALVAHELAHYARGQALPSGLLYPLYSGTVAALEDVEDKLDVGIWGAVQVPAYTMISYFLDAFEAAAERFTERRERAADATAARIAGNDVLAIALTKLHVYARYWRRATAQLRDAVARGEKDVNLALLYTDVALAAAQKELPQRGVDVDAADHPTDLHPPLDVRLEALGHSLEDAAAHVLGQAAGTLALRPATDLVIDQEALERGLTEQERERMLAENEVFLAGAR